MRLLLFSGGLDSAALAAWQRPEALLTIDYGQRAAAGERRSAREVAGRLELALHELSLDCSVLGSGLLAGAAPHVRAPSPEWWPFRNQLLVTIAAAWGVGHGFNEILIGCVAEDHGHADGRREFIDVLDRLLAEQEGGVRLVAPAIAMTTPELLEVAGVTPALVGWTHSCDRRDLACGQCPSCHRRAAALTAWRAAQPT